MNISLEFEGNQPKKNEFNTNTQSMMQTLLKNEQLVKNKCNHSNLSYYENQSNETSEIWEKLDTMKIDQSLEEKQKNSKKQSKFYLVKIISSNIQKLIYLIISLLLPYLNFYYRNDEQNQNLELTQIQYKSILIILIFQLIKTGIKIIIGKNCLYQIKLQIKQSILILLYFSCYYSCNILLVNIPNLCYFYYGFNILDNVLLSLPIKYKTVIYSKQLIIFCYILHFLTCLVAQLEVFNSQNIEYKECLLYGLQLVLFTFQNQNKNDRWIEYLNFIITFAFIFNFFYQLILLENEKNQKQNSLNYFKAYLYSKELGFMSKYILFRKSQHFLNFDQKNQQNNQNLFVLIKSQLIKNWSKKFKFISEDTFKNICNQGEIISNQINEVVFTNLDGIFIILSGNVILSFLGLQVSLSNKQVSNLSVIESFNNQCLGMLKIKKVKNYPIIYFYISKDRFRQCFSEQLQKEVFHLSKDQISLNEDTSKFQIVCLFCNKYHPSFVCQCFNVKKWQINLQANQDRQKDFKRKKKIKVRVYQNTVISLNDIKNQESSNQAIIEQISESFGNMSDSSDHQTHQAIFSNYVIQCIESNQLPQLETPLFQSRTINSTNQIQLIGQIQNQQYISNSKDIEAQISEEAKLMNLQFLNLDSDLNLDSPYEFKIYYSEFNLNNILKKFANNY